jgi:hypothetical protein
MTCPYGIFGNYRPDGVPGARRHNLHGTWQRPQRSSLTSRAQASPARQESNTTSLMSLIARSSSLMACWTLPAARCSPVSPSAASRASPAENSRRATMPLSSPAIRSRSSARRNIISGEPATVLAGGLPVGRAPGPGRPGIPSARAVAALDESRIANAPASYPAVTGRATKSPERRGYLHPGTGLAQDAVMVSLPRHYAGAPSRDRCLDRCRGRPPR